MKLSEQTKREARRRLTSRAHRLRLLIASLQAKGASSGKLQKELAQIEATLQRL